MKTLLIFAALGLAACAHETTSMDRELALKLVDKAGRIEIVQSGGSPLLGTTNQQERTIASAPEADTRTNCTDSPVYNMQGILLKYVHHCFGGQ